MEGMGEFELIERFLERFPAAGPTVQLGNGDDAALVKVDDPVVISVDSVVEGVHFTRPAFPMRAIGRKAVSAALSDLAAMGAAALHALVVVGIPPGLKSESLLELADGVGEAVEREGVTVIGGDISRAPCLLVSVTVIGSEPPGRAAVTRAAAQPGDLVVVTGALGGARAALELLDGVDDIPQALLDRQLDPRPRIREGEVLAEAGASAMIDLSDGLLADADRLARASGVTLRLALDQVPVDTDISSAGIDDDAARRFALTGGEDYELLACIDADALEAAREECGSTLTVLGSVVAEGPAPLVDADSGEAIEAEGFDHLEGN